MNEKDEMIPDIIAEMNRCSASFTRPRKWVKISWNAWIHLSARIANALQNEKIAYCAHCAAGKAVNEMRAEIAKLKSVNIELAEGAKANQIGIDDLHNRYKAAMDKLEKMDEISADLRKLPSNMYDRESEGVDFKSAWCIVANIANRIRLTLHGND